MFVTPKANYYYYYFLILSKIPATYLQNLSRWNSAIDIVHLSDDYDEFLGKPGPLRCTFPWSVEPVRVDRRFWESLVCLDPPKKGWLMDEVNYLNLLFYIHCYCAIKFISWLTLIYYYLIYVIFLYFDFKFFMWNSI